jgi:glycosyltransferase involved in cell wall biosynthesis
VAGETAAADMISAASASDIEVLLSTHNGEPYLTDQIASVLAQTEAPRAIRVRDDGSSDRTVEILRKLAAGDRRLQLTEGPCIGSSRSFLTLLENSSPDARFFAFCDQDDVWLPDKLARAVASLDRLDDRPALYGSAMLHVCDRLQPIGATRPPRAIDFRNALVQNVVAGCTMVINRAAKALCVERMPISAPMHDWWLYLLVSAFGTVIYDDEVTLLHRVHDRNATMTHLWRHWPRRVATHVQLPPGRRLSAMAREFLRLFGDRLEPDKRRVVDQLLDARAGSWWARGAYALSPAVFRQTPVDNAILRVLLAFGRF